jgi:hypothetical protein
MNYYCICNGNFYGENGTYSKTQSFQGKLSSLNLPELVSLMLIAEIVH